MMERIIPPSRCTVSCGSCCTAAASSLLIYHDVEPSHQTIQNMPDRGRNGSAKIFPSPPASPPNTAREDGGLFLLKGIVSRESVTNTGFGISSFAPLCLKSDESVWLPLLVFLKEQLKQNDRIVLLTFSNTRAIHSF